jgi:phosphoglycolate phosphatase
MEPKEQSGGPVPFHIEVACEFVARGSFRAVLFDFDGTLSLIRAGWQDVMIPMMVELLRSETNTDETDAELEELVTEYVTTLTGRQTIYQMIRLSEEIHRRGGQPRDPLEYKRLYHARLEAHIRHRIEGLQRGTLRPEDLTVPGTFELLRRFQEAGVTLYLASGTDLVYVRQEAGLLGLTPFFEPRIYGAIDQYHLYSKRKVVQQLLQENGLQGHQLLAFGDGYVEIQEVVQVGGVAIGVATDEQCRGGFSPWKRRRLLEAGAAAIIPHYGDVDALWRFLWTPGCEAPDALP